MRRWDHQGRDDLTLAADGAIPIKESDPNVESDPDAWGIMLEDGILIQFSKPTAPDTNTYRTGDYWIVPARVATGNVEWPQTPDGKSPLAMPPDGINHVYAPLAWSDNRVDSSFIDLRRSSQNQL